MWSYWPARWSYFSDTLGINVRADIVDVELLTKRVAVLFKKLRIRIVILDRGGARSVLQLRRVRIHRKEIHIREFPRRFAVSVALIFQ